ncbi:MAG: hypothetical protein K2X93_01195 [Candidatus Obscuribacterales bacterium]|nr:hypothetical protein [Candidatus Obscuribacterales bacterium]
MSLLDRAMQEEASVDSSFCNVLWAASQQKIYSLIAIVFACGALRTLKEPGDINNCTSHHR